MNDRNKEIVQYYERLAKDYDKDRFGNSYGRYIDAQERRVLDALDIDTRKALDLPCGTGRLLDYAAHGADASENMLEVARERYKDKALTCCDAMDLPFEDHTFGTVITMHFLMHLDLETIRKVMLNVHRVLLPGGRWIVDVPSLKRRKLLDADNKGWHGNTALDYEEVESMVSGLFSVKSVHGMMMIPVHRLPDRVRMAFCGMDYRLAQINCLKGYSSYLIYELCKL